MAPSDTSMPGTAEESMAPRRVCRVCGYDVTAMDWHRASYRCPECGGVNIPGDARVSPLDPRRALRLGWSLLLVLWPGLLTGVVIGVHAFIDRDWSAMVGVFAGLLGGVLCLTWPWAAAEILFYGRLPERTRARWMPWGPMLGMVGNVAVAVVVARGMFVVG
jgi:predicted RNA-binding Zn-ribbon protein involved in translation (DUF1610 family)